MWSLASLMPASGLRLDLREQPDVVEVAELLMPAGAAPRIPRYERPPIQSVRDWKASASHQAVGDAPLSGAERRHGGSRALGRDGSQDPDLVDIVELTETGSSLRANNLRIVDTVLTSTTRLICSHKAWADPEKRSKLEHLAMLLSGVLEAETRVLLKMNVSGANLAAVVALLPALHAPTVSSLNGDGWHAVETVVEENLVRELIPALREAGAQGIIELPINKIIL